MCGVASESMKCSACAPTSSGDDAVRRSGGHGGCQLRGGTGLRTVAAGWAAAAPCAEQRHSVGTKSGERHEHHGAARDALHRGRRDRAAEDGGDHKWRTRP